MPERYERVEPTPFDAAPPPGSAGGGPSDRGLPKLALPALAVLLAAAMFVFFLLPRLVDEPAVQIAGTPAGADDGASGSVAPRPPASPAQEQPAGTAASPYADAVEAKARAEAQELLSELIDVRENLEDRGALDWAAEAMAAVSTEATTGDERYRERDFEAAITSYQTALDLALELEGSLPERFSAQLAALDAALEALEPDAAQTARNLAEQIEPGAPELVSRDTRLEALPQVMAALEEGRAAEDQGDLEGAVGALEAARDLDREHQYVAAELQRLSEALNEQRFNAAMSEGYAALDAAEFGRAQGRFEAASKLKPGSAEASAALLELSGARTAAELAKLRGEGEALAAAEDWDAAIKVYEQALAVDGSLRFAREGLELAGPRARIDTELKAIIDTPERLVDDAILSEARASLQRARAVATPGPRLAEQLSSVSAIIDIASTPLPVRLTSDQETAVTVYKVARLGAFDVRNLDLRPGTYTAVGTRRGYRDVRVEFTVAPGSAGPFHIACTEAI